MIFFSTKRPNVRTKTKPFCNFSDCFFIASAVRRRRNSASAALKSVSYTDLRNHRIPQIKMVGCLHHVFHAARQNPVMRYVPVVTDAEIEIRRPAVDFVHSDANDRVEPHILSDAEHVVDVGRDVYRTLFAAYVHRRRLYAQPVEDVVAETDADAVFRPMPRVGVERVPQTDCEIALLLRSRREGDRAKKDDCRNGYRRNSFHTPIYAAISRSMPREPLPDVR